MTALRLTRGTALTGLLTLLALTAAPVAGASASTGGLSTATAAPAPEPAPTAVTASPARRAMGTSAALPGAGTWRAAPTTVVGKPVRIVGHFKRALAGVPVRIERQTPAGRWLSATTTRVRPTGRFLAHWRTRSARYHVLRVVLGRPKATPTVPSAAARTATTATAASESSVRVAVLDRAVATWYGPGFYGRKTACGVVLRPDTVGVAHRRLPCGTQVEVRKGGKTIVAPVIDRGPFANGASLDLTKNLADDIGLDGVGNVRFVQRSDLRRLPTPLRAPAV